MILDQVRDHDVATPAGSLWHKGAYKRTIPCMEATYPLCHKRAGVAISWKYFSSSVKLSTNESQASTIPTNESAPLCSVFPDLPDEILENVCPVGGREHQHKATADVYEASKLHPSKSCSIVRTVVGWNYSRLQWLARPGLNKWWDPTDLPRREQIAPSRMLWSFRRW